MQNIYQKYRQDLSAAYTPHEIGLLFRACVAEVCQVPYQQTYFVEDLSATPAQKEILEKMLVRLSQNEPLQYVLGKEEFAGLTFEVNPAVLIPRPETAELVQRIIADVQTPTLPSLATSHLSILDVGTGSGCIAVSLAHALPQAEVTAVDISEKALATARANAERHHVTIHTQQLDFLHSWEGIDHPFTILVSNPPYIVPSEKAQMEANVLNYEPSSALFVPEDQPLLFYDELARFATAYAEVVYLEVNAQFAQQTAAAFQQKGFQTQVILDSFGQSRFVQAFR